MLKYHRVEILNYSNEDLFNLVIDVESYPEFIPWCIAARIIEKQDNVIKAELLIKFKGVSYKYVSLINLQEFSLISIDQFVGPFEYLRSSWKFNKLSENQTKLEISIDFSFKSSLLNKLSRIFSNTVSKKISDAFIARAQYLYRNDQKSKFL